MKLFAFAVALLAASVSAEECSEAQMEAVYSAPEYKALKAAQCGNPVSATTVCAAHPCVAGVKALVKILPDCSNEGVDLKAGTLSVFGDYEKRCDTQVAALVAKGASSTTSSTTECSPEQVATIKASKYEGVVMSTCGTLPRSDQPELMAQTCSEACQSAWKASLEHQPDCAIVGLNMKKLLTQQFEGIQTRCATFQATASPASPSTVNATSSSPAATTPAPASSSSSARALRVPTAIATTLVVGIVVMPL